MPHPYAHAADHRLWRRAMAAPPPAAVDPAIGFPFRLTPQDAVVTAGSCFAQHIARHLRARGFNYLVTEKPHPLLDAATAEAHGYGLYSARYGNIYTSRQLLQLAQRALGMFQPAEDAWYEDGAVFDPFRPTIQPGGFASRLELLLDQQQHLAAVRTALETLDIFVFTLGLTEAWESRIDGAVFPVCPGTARGVFDPARHALRNLSVGDVVQDLHAFLALLRGINPGARVILTVSPVPLVATAEDRHVLDATILAKSKLRAAADEVCRTGQAAYFPSYDIITGPHTRGAYFAADLRSITEQGVAHVMDMFFRNCTTAPVGAPIGAPAAAPRDAAPSAPDAFAAMRAAVEVLCDETAHDAA